MDRIPSMQDPDVYSEHSFGKETFVCVDQDNRFDVRMQYPILKMQHAEKKCYMRLEVYQRLCKAAARLPKGYRFRIWDAWRPFALQKELYEVYKEKIIREFSLESLGMEEQKEYIKRFVSEPIDNKEIPPVHTTGGAIDLTIIDQNGLELPMGTTFDEFTERTHTSYYEKNNNPVFRDNRRLLYHIMIEAGFTNLPSEWWHYDYGDRFWSFYQKQPAIYEGKFQVEEINVTSTKEK